MLYMKERCGAFQVGTDRELAEIEFRVFLPSGPDPEIQSIRVAGEFQPHLGGKAWDFSTGPLLLPTRSDARGDFFSARTHAPVPAGFYQYKYLVTFDDGSSRIVSDPCTRYGGYSHQNAGVVVGGSQPHENRVRPLHGGRRPLSELTLYEVMIDDFTDDYRGVRAPLDALVDKLDYLAALGVTGIVFMPWTARRNGAYDWGYEPFQYFAVEARYSLDLAQRAEKLSHLKRLVSECHDRGIHVIMDGVFNHVSPDFPYRFFYRDPNACPFVGGFGGSFPGLLDLDFDHACTREFVRDVCLYWIEEFGIDGIRFDNTVNFYVPGDPHGLPGLLHELRAELDGRGELNFSLTLEHLSTDAAALTNRTGATSFWDDSLRQISSDYLWNGRIDPGLLNALNNRQYLDDPEKVPTLYLGNHDHSQLGFQAGARTNQGGLLAYRTQPLAIALFTSTATPMLQNGQEFGEEHPMPEDDRGTGRRVLPRPLRWKCASDDVGANLLKLYRRLSQIRHDYPGLRARGMYPELWETWQTQMNPFGVGLDTDRQVAIYHRWGEGPRGETQTFVVVLNFSDREQWASVPFPSDGRWTDLLSDYEGSWRPEVSGGRLEFSVGPHWGHVFFKD